MHWRWNTRQMKRVGRRAQAAAALARSLHDTLTGALFQTVYIYCRKIDGFARSGHKERTVAARSTRRMLQTAALTHQRMHPQSWTEALCSSHLPLCSKTRHGAASTHHLVTLLCLNEQVGNFLAVPVCQLHLQKRQAWVDRRNVHDA